MENILKKVLKLIDDEIVSTQDLTLNYGTMTDTTYDDGVIEGLNKVKNIIQEELDKQNNEKEKEERFKYLDKLSEIIEKQFEYYKDLVVNDGQDDYCEEMALMYNLNKCLNASNYAENLSNKDLKVVCESANNTDNFITCFLNAYYDDGVGNSFDSIKKSVLLSIEKLKEIGGR